VGWWEALLGPRTLAGQVISVWDGFHCDMFCSLFQVGESG